MNICQIKDEKNKEYYFFENIYLYYKTQTNFKDIFLEIMTLIFGIITNFFYMFYYILVIKYFSPMHIIFFNLTYRFGFHVVDIIFILFINKNNSRNDNNSGTLPIIITCFGYINIILVWFGLLVYLEMIVLNFCKFNYNLRENTINRSIKEYELDNTIDNARETCCSNVDNVDNEEEKVEEKGRDDSIINLSKNELNLKINTIN